MDVITMAHIALAQGISEPTVHHTIRKIEDVLTGSGTFTLPGKKVLRGNDIVLGSGGRKRHRSVRAMFQLALSTAV